MEDPAPLAVGAGDLVKLTPRASWSTPTLAGTVLVRVRWTPYWSIAEGTGCVEESPGGFTTLDVREPGGLQDRR